jgi:hypothetical protein
MITVTFAEAQAGERRSILPNHAIITLLTKPHRLSTEFMAEQDSPPYADTSEQNYSVRD